jgi:DNA-directed RNA polymerase specialized sigma24 family protein
MAQANGREIIGANAFATAADFEQIFTQDMSGLYLLSFLLAGDPNKAEECFAAGIEESTKGKRVFKEWARSWARRSVIQSAIRVIEPREHSERELRPHDVARTIDKLPAALQPEVSAIVELAPFERFVLVMSVLERYSDHDCSILLGCARRDVAAARDRALRQLARSISFQKNEAATGSEHSVVHEAPDPIADLAIAQYFATQRANRNLSQVAPVWP